jgi:hypothetical protein
VTRAPSLIGLFVAPVNRAGIEYMVARMVEISRSDVDQQVLDDWIARLRLGAEWTKALAYRDRRN